MEKEVTKDMVNSPSHYSSGDIECIDAMKAAYGKEAIKHFCMCNAFKYLWRFDKKNGTEDLDKAEWYQNKLRGLLGKNDNSPKVPDSKFDKDYLLRKLTDVLAQDDRISPSEMDFIIGVVTDKFRGINEKTWPI